MLKKTLLRTFIGFILGMAIGNIIAIVSSYASSGVMQVYSGLLLEKTGSPAAAMLCQTLLSGLLGAVSWAGISLYEFEDWNLVKAPVIHFAMILGTYLPIALSCGWFAPTFSEIFFHIVIMAAAFALIWLIMYLRYQHEVRELNELLSAPGKPSE